MRCTQQGSIMYTRYSFWSGFVIGVDFTYSARLQHGCKCSYILLGVCSARSGFMAFMYLRYSNSSKQDVFFFFSFSG